MFSSKSSSQASFHLCLSNHSSPPVSAALDQFPCFYRLCSSLFFLCHALIEHILLDLVLFCFSASSPFEPRSWLFAPDDDNLVGACKKSLCITFTKIVRTNLFFFPFFLCLAPSSSKSTWCSDSNFRSKLTLSSKATFFFQKSI